MVIIIIIIIIVMAKIMIWNNRKIDIVIQCNMKIVSYLDVNIEWSNQHPKNKFPPYRLTKPYLINQKKCTK